MTMTISSETSETFEKEEGRRFYFWIGTDGYGSTTTAKNLRGQKQDCCGGSREGF